MQHILTLRTKSYGQESSLILSGLDYRVQCKPWRPNGERRAGEHSSSLGRMGARRIEATVCLGCLYNEVYLLIPFTYSIEH